MKLDGEILGGLFTVIVMLIHGGSSSVIRWHNTEEYCNNLDIGLVIFLDLGFVKHCYSLPKSSL